MPRTAPANDNKATAPLPRPNMAQMAELAVNLYLLMDWLHGKRQP